MSHGPFTAAPPVLPDPGQMTRRSWLSQLGQAAIATSVAPLVLPSRVFGANERIVFGFIGVGERGTSLLESAPGDKAAVCDVDASRAQAAAAWVRKTGAACHVESDYRKLLDRPDIDAVCVATPDHWHALATIHACQAGKHVYCEKPLSLTIAEGRQMVKVARQFKRVVQTGLQQRSDERFRTACELVRNGALGTLQTVKAGIPPVRFRGKPGPDSSPPPELDYQRWLGPAPDRPYNVGRVHYNFRYFRDYSGGQTTNWGTHHVDIVQWALDMDESGPVSAEGTALPLGDVFYDVPNTSLAKLRYANGVELQIVQNDPTVLYGVTFIGSRGQLFVDREKLVATPESLLTERRSSEVEIKLPVSTDHFANMIEAIKTGQKPIADVEVGHRTATVCHLANIALRLGRKVVWNPETEEFTNDPEAQAMVSRPMRKPWTLPG